MVAQRPPSGLPPGSWQLLAPLPAPGGTAALEESLDRIEKLLTRPLVTEEALAFGEVYTSSVAVGDSFDTYIQLASLAGAILPASHFGITQIDIAAPQLTATDAVRLRIYRQFARREPQDMVADFDGASQLTGMWYASFANRRIEYTDSGKENKIWLRIRNASGNSGTSSFLISIYGRPLPI